MFRQIRNINHQVAYELASYGLKDRNPISGPERPPNKVIDKTKHHQDIDNKLATLQSLVDKGDITSAAFQQVKDQQMIKRVMGE